MNAPKTLFAKFLITETSIQLKDPDISEDEFLEAVEQYLALVRSQEIKLGDLLHQFRKCFPGEHQTKLIPHLTTKHREKKKWLESVMSAAKHLPFNERYPELTYAHYNDTQSLPLERRRAVLAKIRERIRAGNTVTTKETRQIRGEVQDGLNDIGNA
jgi:hypothetical protein